MLVSPKCFNSFIKFCQRDNFILNKYLTKLKNVKPFDVSLRDGLQGLSIEDQNKLKPLDKIILYYHIKETYNPPDMEIGSLVSNKILPIFQDSDSFYNYIEYNQSCSNQNNTNNFILIPNESQFQYIHKFNGLNCFSFISSVSESFQLKNTKMSLDTTFKQIHNMMCILDDKPIKSKVKIYLSCINECPIDGKIDNNLIVDKIIQYQQLKPDILCLSDTCGSLNINDFEYIIDNVNKYNKFNNYSLHLHVKPERENEVENIIHKALDFGITNFDVSAVESGGCSVTMKKSQLSPNLSYELFYKSLSSYLLK